MSRPGTILVVEDDSGIAESLRQVLEDEGHAVIAATTGEEGLALAAKKNCDVVLTDLKLPDLSGLDIVKRLRTSNAGLPIILMTAHGTTDIAIESTRHGAFDYLLKPLDPTLLERSLDGILQRRRLRQEHASLMAENLEYLGVLSLYERTLAVERIRAARAAIDATGTGVVLTARCEAWLVGDPDPLRPEVDAQHTTHDGRLSVVAFGVARECPAARKRREPLAAGWVGCSISPMVPAIPTGRLPRPGCPKARGSSCSSRARRIRRRQTARKVSASPSVVTARPWTP